MKKLVLTAVLLSAVALKAELNPLQAFGPAPTAPTKSGGFMSDMGSMFSGTAGSLGSAATGIPPVNLGLGIGITTTTQKQQQAQNIKVQGGDASSVQAQIQAGQTGIQTATSSTSATGMGK